MKLKTTVQKYCLAGLLFLVVWALLLPIAKRGLDPHHDGIMLKPALDVAEGKVLYRDSFSQYGPIPTWVQAWFIHIEGKKLLAIHHATVGCYALAAVLSFLILSEWLPILLSAGLALLWLGLGHFLSEARFLPWSSAYALVFQLSAVLSWVISYRKGKLFWLAYSAGFMTLAFFCKQPVGLFGLMSLFSISIYRLFATRKFLFFMKEILIQSIGVGAVLLGFVMLFLYQGALKDWLEQNIYFAFIFSSKFGVEQNGGLNKLKEIIFGFRSQNHGAWMTLIGVGFLGLGSTALALFRFERVEEFLQKQSVKEKLVLIFALSSFGLASWLQIYPIAGTHHVFHASVVWYLLLCLVSFKGLKRLEFAKSQAGLMTMALILLLFSPVLVERALGAWEKINTYTNEVIGLPALEGMLLSSGQAAFVQEAKLALDHLPSKSFPLTHIGGDALYFCLWPHLLIPEKVPVNWDLTAKLYPLDDQNLFKSSELDSRGYLLSDNVYPLTAVRLSNHLSNHFLFWQSSDSIGTPLLKIYVPNAYYPK